MQKPSNYKNVGWLLRRQAWQFENRLKQWKRKTWVLFLSLRKALLCRIRSLSLWNTGLISHSGSSKSRPLELTLRQANGLKFSCSIASICSRIVMLVSLIINLHFYNSTSFAFFLLFCKYFFIFLKQFLKQFVYYEFSQLSH